MNLAFQFLDIVVVLIIIASTAYATWRGFVSETLSILAWAAAAFATLYFGPWVAFWLRGMINPPWLGEVTGYGAVFLAVVIPLSFMSFRFSQSVKKSAISPLDRALGAAFGVVRGLAIIGIAYVVFTAFVPIPDQPDWVLNTRFLPLIQGSAEVITSLIPEQHVGNDTVDTAPADSQQERDKAALDRKIEQQAAAPLPPRKHHKKTHGANDEQKLDKLIETTSSGTP
jgi:membrane protein required for colicin V production